MSPSSWVIDSLGMSQWTYQKVKVKYFNKKKGKGPVAEKGEHMYLEGRSIYYCPRVVSPCRSFCSRTSGYELAAILMEDI